MLQARNVSACGLRDGRVDDPSQKTSTPSEGCGGGEHPAGRAACAAPPTLQAKACTHDSTGRPRVASRHSHPLTPPSSREAPSSIAAPLLHIPIWSTHAQRHAQPSTSQVAPPLARCRRRWARRAAFSWLPELSSSPRCWPWRRRRRQSMSGLRPGGSSSRSTRSPPPIPSRYTRLDMHASKRQCKF